MNTNRDRPDGLPRRPVEMHRSPQTIHVQPDPKAAAAAAAAVEARVRQQEAGQGPGEVEDRPKTGSGQKNALETRGPCGRCGLPVLTSHPRYVAGGCYYHQVLLPDYPSRVPLRLPAVWPFSLIIV